MKFEIRERDRRALLLLIAAAIVYGVLSFGLLPAFDQLKGSSGGVTEKEDQLRKYRRAVIRKGHYAELLQQARRNLADGELRFVRGDNPSLAAVELQTIVEDAAKKTGIELSQRTIAPARKRDEYFNEITMALALDATPSQVAGFLLEIRNAPKFITVRSAQIAPAQVLMEAPKKGDFLKTMHANITIAALIPAAVRKS
jgi:hypothetical protein